LKSKTKQTAWYVYQEKANSLLGFASTKGSGNQHGNGDGLSTSFMHECKYRESETLSIPKDEWIKFNKECKNHNKKPVFTIIRKINENFDMITALRTEDLSEILFSDKISKNKVLNETIDFLIKELKKYGIQDQKINSIVENYESFIDKIGI
jgi:NAD+--asparagine ADP-ribosyltransferase